MIEVENFFSKPKDIDLPIVELATIMCNNFLEIERMKWWLINFENLYQATYNYHINQYLYKDDNGTIISLPHCIKTTKEQKFINIYEELNKIIDFHKNEGYFKEQISIYNKIKTSKTALKNWIIKNEQIVDSEYILFELDYLETAEDLKIYFYQSEEIEIFIKSEYFKNTIEFLEIFNDLYWVKKVFPESKILTEIRAKLNHP